MSEKRIVYFAHGKESGPWGSKITRLAEVARSKGFEVISPEYNGLSPDERVEKLRSLVSGSESTVVLVGSSLGAYVSTLASVSIKPVGLFLIAPAIYLDGYGLQDPTPSADKIWVVHGLNDEVVPYQNSIRFCSKFGASLHLLDGDHRLTDQIDEIAKLFALFLEETDRGSGGQRTLMP